jgi:hypothetical protein
MTVYRMYTEDVNRPNILRVLDARFDGYTIIPTIGAWRGKQENSLLIELFNTDKASVIEAASKIATMNNQEAVAVMELDAAIDFASSYHVPQQKAA